MVICHIDSLKSELIQKEQTMSKSKLAMTDDLVVDLTLALSEEIANRRNLITKNMSSREKRGRCDCIHVFGEKLRNLRDLRHRIEQLRKSHKLENSPELREVLQSTLPPDDWFSFRQKIDVEKRIKKILSH